MKYLYLALTLALLGGCATKKPDPISQIAVDPLTLADVRLDVDRHIGKTIRWGGVISRVDNKADVTWVELVHRVLKNNERPITDGVSEGRFIASFKGFSDPVIYKVGRPLTVVGAIQGQVSRPIGEFDYNFPIISVQESHLWSQQVKVQQVPYYPPNWWYSDFYFHSHFPHRHRHYW